MASVFKDAVRNNILTSVNKDFSADILRKMQRFKLTTCEWRCLCIEIRLNITLGFCVVELEWNMSDLEIHVLPTATEISVILNIYAIYENKI